MIPIPVYIFVFIELIFVSWGDLKTKKIPNLWVLLNFVIFLVLLFLFNEEYIFTFKTFLYPMIWIIVGFIFFYLKIMGGGDSKFLASLFLLIPLKIQDLVFYNLILSTIFIGLTVFLFNLTRNWNGILDCLRTKNFQMLKQHFGTKFTYAPVIFVSWVFLGWDLNLF